MTTEVELNQTQESKLQSYDDETKLPTGWVKKAK
jgi:hypothetical protein